MGALLVNKVYKAFTVPIEHLPMAEGYERGWFFVPEGHMTGPEAGSRPGGDPRIPPLMPKPRIGLC